MLFITSVRKRPNLKCLLLPAPYSFMVFLKPSVLVKAQDDASDDSRVENPDALHTPPKGFEHPDLDASTAPTATSNFAGTGLVADFSGVASADPTSVTINQNVVWIDANSNPLDKRYTAVIKDLKEKLSHDQFLILCTVLGARLYDFVDTKGSGQRRRGITVVYTTMYVADTPTFKGLTVQNVSMAGNFGQSALASLGHIPGPFALIFGDAGKYKTLASIQPLDLLANAASASPSDSSSHESASSQGSGSRRGRSKKS